MNVISNSAGLQILTIPRQMSAFKIHYLLFVLSIFLLPDVFSIPLFNDLLPLYENSSQETSENAERIYLFMEQIENLALFLIQNVSQLCPLDQPNYFRRIEKIVKNTLRVVYENEETLSNNIFYDNIIPPVRATLEKCLASAKSKISLDEFNKQEYPETILHLDLKFRSDITKWQDFRPCIRTQIKSSFYPGTIPSTIDTLWQTFLLGYMGCSDHWGSIKQWNFLDLFQQIVMRPLFQRWSSKFPTRSTESFLKRNNGTISSEIIDVLSQGGVSGHEKGSQLSFDAISAWLEKCNVILFLRHSIDPVPCFRDVIYNIG